MYLYIFFLLDHFKFKSIILIYRMSIFVNFEEVIIILFLLLLLFKLPTACRVKGKEKIS